MTATGTLLVSEVFGPTIQGEGPSLGRRAWFVRLMGCNLTCTWCDTPYTWDAARHDLTAETTNMLPTDILPRIEADNAGLTVVTGGEPLLHQRKPAFSSMIDALARIGDVEIETNGTIPPVKGMPAAFNASVKLASSGVPEALRYRPSAVDALNEAGARFKFVAKDVRDLDEIGHIVDAHHLPHSNIWVMPEGTTAEAVLSGTRRIADDVIRHGWNLTTRLHTIIWGQERAR